MQDFYFKKNRSLRNYFFRNEDVSNTGQFIPEVAIFDKQLMRSNEAKQPGNYNIFYSRVPLN